MAKQRRNSVVSAISAVTETLRLESIPNPTPEQQQQIHEAKVAAADVIDNSNFVSLGENADDAIEAQIQAEEAREEAIAEAEEQQAIADADAEIEEEFEEAN